MLLTMCAWVFEELEWENSFPLWRIVDAQTMSTKTGRAGAQNTKYGTISYELHQPERILDTIVAGKLREASSAFQSTSLNPNLAVTFFFHALAIF